jgi:hypothetical protein
VKLHRQRKAGVPATAQDEGHVRWQLLGATIVLFAVRASLGLTRTGPLVVADEIGYLTGARVLAGGVPGDLRGAPFYHGGYSLLLAPLLALGAGPLATYRIVLVANALLAASLVPLLYLLLSRSFGVARRHAVLASVAGATYPAVTLSSQAALSENLLVPLTVVWLLAVGEVLQRHGDAARTRWSAAAGLCAAALWAVHGRMIIAVALTAGGLVAAALARRLELRACLAGVATLLAGLAGTALLDGHLLDRNYGGVAVDEVGERLGYATDVDGLLPVARNLVGQTWYLLAATLGVVLVLIMRDGSASIRRLMRRDAGPADVLMCVLLATTAALLAVSALSFRFVTRPDMVIYGRYVEVVVPSLLALGVARLASGAPGHRLWAPLVVLGGLTLAVAVLRGAFHVPGTPSRWNVAALPFLTGDLDAAPLLAAGLVAVVLAYTVLAIARRRPGAVGAVVVLAFLPTTAYVLRDTVRATQRSVYPSGWTSPATRLPSAGTSVVGYDEAHADRFGRFTYQWFLPDARVVAFPGGSSPAPSRYLISSVTWNREQPARPAQSLWSDPGRDQTLWRLAGTRER